MEYTGFTPHISISVDEIITIYYFEYTNTFSFPGESHDFWEFICVDKGEIQITGGTQHYLLKKGDIAFHQPLEFHDVHGTGKTASNLVVMSFQCADAAMDFFREKIFHIDETERMLLANIIQETRQCFPTRNHYPLIPKENTPFGSEQLIKIYLEQFLIHIYRRCSKPVTIEKQLSNVAFTKINKRNNDTVLFHHIIEYLEQNLHRQVTIEQICKDNLISRSQLQTVFKKHCNQSAIEYYLDMKTETAKLMIRNHNMNFTQISESLGYSSIHYFSRQFKKLTGMTPSEYASSIKALGDKDT